MSTRIPAAAIACLLVALAPRTGRAEDPPPVDAKARAKAHATAGTRYFNVQQYENAGEEYQQAYLLDPQPSYLYAAGQAQRLGGDCEKALLSYGAYLRTKPSAAEAKKAELNIERCEQDLKDRPPLQPLEIAPPLDVPPPPEPPPIEAPVEGQLAIPASSRWPGHLLVGAGVAFAGAGGFLLWTGRTTIAAHNASPSYDDFDTSRAGIDRARLAQRLGVSGLATGGALLVGGIIYYLTRSDGAPELSATVSSDGAALVFTRGF
jgi:tetratricopeptide (TPR) repeat protein